RHNRAGALFHTDAAGTFPCFEGLRVLRLESHRQSRSVRRHPSRGRRRRHRIGTRRLDPAARAGARERLTPSRLHGRPVHSAVAFAGAEAWDGGWQSCFVLGATAALVAFPASPVHQRLFGGARTLPNPEDPSMNQTAPPTFK